MSTESAKWFVIFGSFLFFTSTSCGSSPSLSVRESPLVTAQHWDGGGPDCWAYASHRHHRSVTRWHLRHAVQHHHRWCSEGAKAGVHSFCCGEEADSQTVIVQGKDRIMVLWHSQNEASWSNVLHCVITF